MLREGMRYKFIDGSRAIVKSIDIKSNEKVDVLIDFTDYNLRVIHFDVTDLGKLSELFKPMFV